MAYLKGEDQTEKKLSQFEMLNLIEYAIEIWIKGYCLIEGGKTIILRESHVAILGLCRNYWNFKEGPVSINISLQ